MSELQKVTEFEALLQRAEAAETALAKSEESRQKLFSALQELKMQEPVGITKHWDETGPTYEISLDRRTDIPDGTKLFAAPVQKVCRWEQDRHTAGEPFFWDGCNSMASHSWVQNFCPNCGRKVEVSDDN